MAIPFLAPSAWVLRELLPTAMKLLTPQPVPPFVDLPRVIHEYGYPPIAFCLLGAFLLAIRGGKKNYSLTLGLLALLMMLAIFYTFHYGLFIVYERGLMYMMLMVSIVAGAGLAGVKNLQLPAKLAAWVKVPLITQNIGRFLCLVLIGIVLAVSIPERQDIAYYHMIDDEDYQAFVWIRDNVDEKYDKAILDPWKATPFTAITQKNIYTRIHASPKPSDIEAAGFLEGECSDTAFLKDNDISIVYTTGSVDNPDLVEVRENVYLVKEPETK